DQLGLPRSALVAVGAGGGLGLLWATAQRGRGARGHGRTTRANRQPAARSSHTISEAAIEVYPTAVPRRLAAGASTAQVGAVFEWLQKQLGVHPSEIFDRDPNGNEPVV